ncbi:hypothetical protein [Microcoleus sp. POL1_C1]|uniref:hypothetical protein n=1 Tax=Microcoleus sp. POL1_C1 TaxID=2818870 RepID=UPI002FCE8A61
MLGEAEDLVSKKTILAISTVSVWGSPLRQLGLGHDIGKLGGVELSIEQVSPC